jgi:poly(A) polymerase Pap1
MEIVKYCEYFLNNEKTKNLKFEVLESVKKYFDICVKRLVGSVEVSGYTIVKYGSSGLEIDLDGSDMDLLCILPDCVNRQNFFTEFEKIMKEHKVEHLRFKRNFLMQFTMTGIRVDIMCATFNSNDIPIDFIEKFDTCSILCLQSIAPYKLTCDLRKRIENLGTYRIFTRFIKIFSNSK